MTPTTQTTTTTASCSHCTRAPLTLRSTSHDQCFFCMLNEPQPLIRKAKISLFLHDIPSLETQKAVIFLSTLWNIAMAHPDDPELPSLGIFDCMARLIKKGVEDTEWLLTGQNIYIPYYAAHVIGSYTMNKPEFAEKAVGEGVVSPLLELLKGKISWVEQRVAVRALGHISSYERTFEALAEFEEELVRLSMDLASNCLELVYRVYVGVKDRRQRLGYHSDLLTRGIGGMEMENRKAEEWASQLQCWSIHLLSCFAYKERSLNLICESCSFLKDLSGMWGGLVNDVSPAGVGLIRILCYSKVGRKAVAELEDVIESLTNLSRSSDDWQYMGIDCLLLLLEDTSTRGKVIKSSSVFSLADLIELRSLGGRSNVGESIIKRLIVSDYNIYGYKQMMQNNSIPGTTKLLNTNKVREALDGVRAHVERRGHEKMMSREKIVERRGLAQLIKHQGNQCFWSGDVEGAMGKYSEALALCPLTLRKERMVLYSNRAQCHLVLRDPDGAISDTTRALCLSKPSNSHGKSLWRRSQAYDMKGLARESLMDCIMFINCHIKLKSRDDDHVKIPHYAATMISKQIEASWLFAGAKLKSLSSPKQRFHLVSSQEDAVVKTTRLDSSHVSAGWFLYSNNNTDTIIIVDRVYKVERS